MTDDYGKFKAWLQPQQNLTFIKGKYTSLTTMGQIEKIQKIYAFDSLKKYFPFLFLQTKFNFYLGITLARQTSDLLVLLAKKMFNEIKFPDSQSESRYYLIQYMLPRDYSSLKLIIIRKIDPLGLSTSWESEKADLIKFQDKFGLMMKKLIDNIDK